MATFDELKTSGIEIFGAVGAWAYDEWGLLNETYFDGKNTPGAIDWVPADHNGSLGCYSSGENRIFLFKGLARPRYPTNMPKWCLENLNKRLASDVLLHEMIHQHIYQTGGWEGETSHNNERFVGEINRIAKLLELNVTAKVITPKMVDDKLFRQVAPGCLTLNEICYFPYSTRPYEYYYGYVP
ncbi:MAG: hypothetical protein ABIK98_15630 [Pseudomonadota bacterium]|uniref:Uncharacterized protein n=1 Tax=Candidatus Desulfatibia profunda TaxID=2841695 RepID=A0A8J6NQI5_9BACT|nr:hypothetical protein [Candidatus Desulfatibia profunda]MBL7179585.1 hypothetical protein [Desulfobacterales bacterium]